MALGLLAVLLAFGAIVAFGSRLPMAEVIKARRESPEYQLLGRWRQHSGRRIFEFPTSNIGSKLFENWAKEEAWERAWRLNDAYSRKKDYYVWVAGIDWSTIRPREGEKRLKDQNEREEWMIRDVAQKKREFLDFWDLITEKTGIGILTGVEWQDPEFFRQKVASQDHRIIIGLRAY